MNRRYKSDEYLNVNATWLNLTYPIKQTLSCRNWHFDQKGRALIKGNRYPVLNSQPQTHSRRLSSFLGMKISDFGTKEFYPLGSLQPYKFSKQVSPSNANRMFALLKLKNHAGVSQ